MTNRATGTRWRFNRSQLRDALPDARIYLPRPLDHQRPILESPARFKLPACGRRFGKTVVGRIAAVAGHGPRDQAGNPLRRGALQGGQIWWLAPTYGVAAMIWRELKESLREAWIEKSEVERRIVLPGGGSITVKSADNPAYLRGPRLDGVVMDEAAYISEEVWTAVIRPTLADSGGWAIFISTPNGLNWYYEAFEAAPRRAGWERWQLPTAANPMIPTEEIEEARATLLPLVFRQEWLAEFVSSVGAEIQPGWLRYFRMDGGEDTTRPDRYILLARGEDGAPRPLPVDRADGWRFGTMDLAASEKTTGDYTVIAACHYLPPRPDRDPALLLLDLDRRRIPGPDQLPAARRMIDRWDLGRLWIEKAGYQLAMVQMARREGLPVDSLEADRDKYARAQPLMTMMKAGQVYFREGAPWLVELERELLAFTGTKADVHDDQVDALAYAARTVAVRKRPKLHRVNWPDRRTL